MSTSPTNPESRVQGEGDTASARHYNEQTKAFVKSGKVDAASKAAAPKNADEAKAMRRAETEGRSHSRGEVPREASKPVTKQAPGKQPAPKPEKAPGKSPGKVRTP